jgi:hypothetical protein
MRYPCSYMIYSPAFEALPVDAKKSIYGRMGPGNVRAVYVRR